LIDDTKFKDNRNKKRKSVIYFRKGLKNPKKAFNHLKRPKKLKSKFEDQKNWGNAKYSFDNLVLDIDNHLVYKSTMNDMRIRTDPEVEKSILENRKKHKNFYIPEKIDELLHLLMHSIYDREGNFKTHYKNKCSKIWNKIDSENQKWNKLSSKAFFKASKRIEEDLDNENYEKMLENLYTYSKY